MSIALTVKLETRVVNKDLGWRMGQKVCVAQSGSTCLGEVYQSAPSGGPVEVLFFQGPGRQSRRTVSPADLGPAQLFSEQRVWCVAGGVSRYGRLLTELPPTSSGLRRFLIRFSNDQSAELDEDAFHLHDDCGPSDPFDALAVRAVETPFFSERRDRFVDALIRQRAAARGMTGLMSSRIELFAHQVEAARRILQDSRRRYLLADEVGLGKTIEAGIVMRQLRLDRPDARFRVLVPARLTEQWRGELRRKFGLTEQTDTEVLPFEWLDREDPAAGPAVHLLVVDEAHRLIREGSGKRLETMDRLAVAVPTLLLLSATPVLGHEAELLRLLSWLEPDLYMGREGAREALAARISHRRDIGRELLALPGPSEPPDAFYLLSAADRLEAMFCGTSLQDAHGANLCRRLREAAEADHTDESVLRRCLRELRVHIAECHRVHRRMIRNRRTLRRRRPDGSPGPTIFATPPARRAPDPENGLQAELDSERKQYIRRALEGWRAHAAFVVETERPGLLPEMTEVFRALVEATGSWSAWAAELVRARLSPVGGRTAAPATLNETADAMALRVIRSVPLLNGEREHLETLLMQLTAESDEADRPRLLTELIRLENRRGTLPAKTVVFTRFTRVAEELSERLAVHSGLPVAPALLHQDGANEDVEKDLHRFRSDPRCRVLICDRTGEEGRNLQFADRIIHFDLPLDPFSVEQRIGRLDRMTRTQPTMTQVVLLSELNEEPDSETAVPGGFDGAWYRLLSDGYGVFAEPVTDLHLCMEQQGPALVSEAFLRGAQAWPAAVANLRQVIEQERRANDEQDVLDSVETDSEAAGRLFADLERYECDETETFQAAVEGFLKEVNRINLIRFRNLDALKRASFHRESQPPVLMREDVFRRLAPMLSEPFRWHRDDAVEYPDNNFLRLGHPLVDELDRLSRTEDRGQASLMWRRRIGQSAPALFARIRAVVDIGFADGGADPALVRLGDMFLPPRSVELVLDERGRPVEEPSLAEHLRRGWETVRGDTNLSNPARIHLLDEVIGAVRWDAACRTWRERAAPSVAGDPALTVAVARALDELDEHFVRRGERLRIRTAYGAADAPASSGDDERALARKMREAVGRPVVRIDSVSVILLSGELCPC